MFWCFHDVVEPTTDVAMAVMHWMLLLSERISACHCHLSIHPSLLFLFFLRWGSLCNPPRSLPPTSVPSANGSSSCYTARHFALLMASRISIFNQPAVSLCLQKLLFGRATLLQEQSLLLPMCLKRHTIWFRTGDQFAGVDHVISDFHDGMHNAI